MSATKVKALNDVLTDRDPFCRGVCSVPEHQFLLYYGQGTDLHRVDFAHSTTEELEALSQACQPASFGLNNKDVLDETYRKAGKMDLDAFATLLDPRSLGIHDIIERDLLATDQAVEFELSKLNVYAKDGFFKAHQDTPRGDNMFGSLVVVLPAQHEGGQFSLRLGDQHWIADFTDQFAAATEPSICFIAFFSDVEHQVLPVTSGYRVTLTYNLHFRAQGNIPRALSGPFHDKLKARLIELVNDAETLPKGGYLGLGLCHQYVYDETKPTDSLLDKLKGSDAVLANVCKELGLPYSLRLLYAQGEDGWPDFHLLSRVKLNAPAPRKRLGKDGRPTSRLGCSDSYDEEHLHLLLHNAIGDFGPEDVEGVEIIGRHLNTRNGLDKMGKRQIYYFMKKYYRDPVSQVLEVKRMSSVLCETAYACYGNWVYTDRFYATGCMIISVQPGESRERLSF
ncbi:hypothetical protein HD554DRAFT_2026474 [Boletus coccyginus]|nr:hypothetical protein HD554DRAFT_2026474 [Boletus coccyginus]